MFCFLDDFHIACKKLAEYYLQEFTEISLYTLSRTEKMIPLVRLYVAMEWIRCNKEGINWGHRRKETENMHEESDNMYCDFTKIIGKVRLKCLQNSHVMTTFISCNKM